MQPTILITGGTGFIGQNLCSKLIELGYQVHVLTQNFKANQPGLSYFLWDIEKGSIDYNAFSNVSIIINLAGANIGAKRWTKSRKETILRSRVKALELLKKTSKDNNFTIETLISSSAVGYYGIKHQDRPHVEIDPMGDDFLAQVCHIWEESAQSFVELGTRVIILRKGVVIGRDGLIKKLLPLAQNHISTQLGDGQQIIPWIEIEDLINLYIFLIKQKEINGIFNAVGEEVITQRQLSQLISETLQKRVVTPSAPASLIKLIFGDQSEMLLYGNAVSNQKLINLGFHFQYPTLREALKKHISNNLNL